MQTAPPTKPLLQNIPLLEHRTAAPATTAVPYSGRCVPGDWQSQGKVQAAAYRGHSPVEERRLADVVNDASVVYDGVAQVAAVGVGHGGDVEHVGLPGVLRRTAERMHIIVHHAGPACQWVHIQQ